MRARRSEVFRSGRGDCASPLPRAYQWADGSAYVTHVELVRKARGAVMPESFWTDPLMYQGGSDSFIGPEDDILAADEAFGIDMEGEVAAITGDVPMGVSPAQAAGQIRLLMLVNDVSLRNLIPKELEKGFGFFQSKPASAFSPVAVTPDELGSHWREGKVHLPLEVTFERRAVRLAQCRRRYDIFVSATDRACGEDARAWKRDRSSVRARCRTPIARADRRASPSGGCWRRSRRASRETPFMRFGDRVRIEMKLPDGTSIFGAIDQKVVRYEGPK